MYCKRCGQTLAPDQRFCRSCGAPNQAAGVPSPEDPAPTGPPEPPVPPPPAESPARLASSRAGLVGAVLVLSLAIAGGAVALIVSGGGPASKTTTEVLAAAPGTDAAPTQGTTGATAPVSTSTPAAVPPTASATTTPATTTPATTTPATTTTTTATTAAGSGPGQAAAALRTYWSDVASGDYAQAAAMETPSERGTDPESRMQAEQPTINVISIGQPSSASGTAQVPIDFWAQDTEQTSFSDTQCRHFVMKAVMIENDDGSWSYAGTVSGSATVTVQNGSPNCHS
jgi:hypothetical protein